MKTVSGAEPEHGISEGPDSALKDGILEKMSLISKSGDILKGI